MRTKQVIIIRKDLKMRKGKMIAQGAHASMKVILDEMIDANEVDEFKTKLLLIQKGFALDNWINGLFTKIVVGCDSEEELLELEKKASDKNIRHAIIEDSGLTEFRGIPTLTALAIGPDDSKLIDEITGHLKLL